MATASKGTNVPSTSPFTRMTLIEKIRSGAFTRKHIVQPQSPQHCLNCGHSYEGAYCPRCGQSHTTGRITWHNFWRTFVMTGIGLQGTLPRTLLELFYRPGFLIRDYLAGKRQHYINPFRCLLLLAAIFVLLQNTVISTDIKASAAAASMSMSNDVAQSTAEQAAAQKATTAMMDTLYSNFGTFNLLLILFMTLPFWVAFRRQGQYAEQPLNLSEAATAIAFVGCQNMVVNVLSLPFITHHNMLQVAQVGYAVVVPLFWITLWQMFDMHWLRFFVRNLLFALLFFFFYIAVIYLLVLCIMMVKA